jgi:hypothetical protein
MKKTILILALTLSISNYANAYAKWTPDGYSTGGINVITTDSGYYIY